MYLCINIYSFDNKENNKTISAKATSDFSKKTNVENSGDVPPWIIIAEFFKRIFGIKK
jgi:hypothetical protein